jgi:hypothetical protein
VQNRLPLLRRLLNRAMVAAVEVGAGRRLLRNRFLNRAVVEVGAAPSTGMAVAGQPTGGRWLPSQLPLPRQSQLLHRSQLPLTRSQTPLQLTR